MKLLTCFEQLAMVSLAPFDMMSEAVAPGVLVGQGCLALRTVVNY